MNRNIPKGTKVRIQTDNGGDAVGVLLENYHATYSAVVDFHGDGHWQIINANRIKNITPITEST